MLSQETRVWWHRQDLILKTMSFAGNKRAGSFRAESQSETQTKRGRRCLLAYCSSQESYLGHLLVSDSSKLGTVNFFKTTVTLNRNIHITVIQRDFL